MARSNKFHAQPFGMVIWHYPHSFRCICMENSLSCSNIARVPTSRLILRQMFSRALAQLDAWWIPASTCLLLDNLKCFKIHFISSSGREVIPTGLWGGGCRASPTAVTGACLTITLITVADKPQPGREQNCPLCPSLQPFPARGEREFTANSASSGRSTAAAARSAQPA